MNGRPAIQQVGAPAAQAQGGGIIADIHGFAFNLGSFVAMDFTGYEEGKEGRAVTLILIHGIEHEFSEEAADSARYWYLQLTGQARVEGA